MKKLKNLHGNCTIEIKKFEYEEFEKIRLRNPSLQISKHCENINDDSPILNEIFEFVQNPSYIPNFYYVNNMYIYLLHANLHSKSGHNIVVSLQVKDNDDPESPALCVSKPILL